MLKRLLLKKLKKKIQQLLLRKKVRRLLKKREKVNVIIGAADARHKGWLATNLPVLDALNVSDWSYIFPPGSIDGALAEHVIEHWTADEFRLFLRIARPFISHRGYIRVAVPDGFHPDPAYINYVKPGGSGSGAKDHKVLYNYITITKVLSEEQCDCGLLEYFDEAGQFHRSLWDISDGFVRRSAEHDARNKESPLSYTSLILDTWPDRI